MKRMVWTASMLVLVLTTMVALALAQQPPAQVPRVDMTTMVRPIEMHDTVFMAELTELENRDLIKAGKTTALVISGGVEGNGPYMVLDKHNVRGRVVGEAIARKLGNALIAPIITIEPGDPANAKIPGAPVFSNETYKAIFTDIATSLRALGFKNIVFIGDSGGNLNPMQDVSKTLNTAWKGNGATIHFIEKYGSSAPDSGCCGWSVVERYLWDVLGVKEVMGQDGYHDEYAVEAMVMTYNPDYVRLQERIKAKKTTINGIDLVPAAKTIDIGKKLINYLADQTVKEIQKLMTAAKSNL